MNESRIYRSAICRAFEWVDTHVKRRGKYIATPSNTVDSAINCQTPAGSNVCPALCASRQGKAKSALLRLTGNCQRLASTLYRLADGIAGFGNKLPGAASISPGPSNTVGQCYQLQTPAGLERLSGSMRQPSRQSEVGFAKADGQLPAPGQYVVPAC